MLYVKLWERSVILTTTSTDDSLPFLCKDKEVFVHSHRPLSSPDPSSSTSPDYQAASLEVTPLHASGVQSPSVWTELLMTLDDLLEALASPLISPPSTFSSP